MVDHEVTSFTFLGYTFRPRLAKSKHGKHFVSFPAGGQQGRGYGDEPGDPLVADRQAQLTSPSQTLRGCSTPSCRVGSTIACPEDRHDQIGGWWV